MEEKKDILFVEPHMTALELPPEGFRLEEGALLPKVEVAWEAVGHVSPKNDNVVFICHALTGDAHVAGRYANEEESSGWWDGIVGPGRAIDTNRYRVICANVLGGCKGTTGPKSINPKTGKPYGGAFPKFTIGDTVEVYRALLKQLGVTHLAALVGGSFGGIQVIEWLAAHPGEVDRAVMIASGVATNAQALAFDIVGRYAIMLDPGWKGGDYYGDNQGGPKVGLAQARQVAHITYLSLDLLNRRFGRKQQENWLQRGTDWLKAHAEHFGTTFAIESYLGYQAEKFLARFDANSYLHITYAMDRYDAAEKYGSLDELCKRIDAKMLLISISGDWLFSAEQSTSIATAMLKAGKRVSYAHLDIKVGHDGFLTHTKELAKTMGGFFTEVPRVVDAEKQRKLAPITDAIKPGARVLDIGCGSGSLLTLLKHKGVKGTGIEIDDAKIAAGITAGLDVLHDDADAGLGIIPDGAYDCAVLSETLQTVKFPRELLLRMLDKAQEAIITFPNFAYYPIRFKILFSGKLPVSRQLPFEWYDTPNIHCVTLKDFRKLCDETGIAIRSIRTESNSIWGRILCALGLRNLGAGRIIARIARKATQVVALAVILQSSCAWADSAAEAEAYDAAAFYAGAAGGILLPGNGTSLKRAAMAVGRVGYDVNDFWAVELEGWSAPNASSARGNVTAWGVGAQGLCHLSALEEYDKLFGGERFDPFITFGVAADFASRAVFAEDSHRSAIGPKGGLGAFYHLTNHASLRVDATARLAFDSPCGMCYGITGGLQWRF